MLITFKNLQQQTFQIEIDASETVKALKHKIEAEKGKDYAVDNQRLIYAGKILNDDNSVSSYHIDENKFIVIMVTKPKATTESTVEAAPSASTESGDGNKSSGAPAAAVAVAAPTPAATVATPAAPTEVARPATATPPTPVEPDFEATVQSIMDMGYSRLQVEQALRASFNNRERAVEYLITGIPDELLQEQEPESEDASDDDPLAFLRDQPQFQQMRAVIQQNPSLLNAVLQQIGQTNPALLQAISQHQQAFVRMLNEPASGAAADADNPEQPQQPQQPLPTNVIQVSPQDKEAIERLKALGFPEHMVIQAYFACEKNENLAANFLISQNFDD